MTKDEKLTIISGACDRAFKQLSQYGDFANSEASHLLDNINSLQWMMRNLEGKEEETYPEHPVISPTLTPTPAEVVEPATEPVETGVEEVKSQYTREQVRAALNVARKEKGVKIPDLLSKFGVATFTDLPESQYDAIMKELGAE